MPNPFFFLIYTYIILYTRNIIYHVDVSTATLEFYKRVIYYMYRIINASPLSVVHAHIVSLQTVAGSRRDMIFINIYFFFSNFSTGGHAIDIKKKKEQSTNNNNNNLR